MQGACSRRCSQLYKHSSPACLAKWQGSGAHFPLNHRLQTLAAAAPGSCTITKLPEGSPTLSFNQDSIRIGSAPGSDIIVAGPEVVEAHAVLLRKPGKQLFIKALKGASMWHETSTWLDDDPLRPNVAYVVASGSRLAFGSPEQVYRIDFDQATAPNAMMEMMMNGMLASAGGGNGR